MAGLYIHIPFCASRCIYCNFYSTTHGSLHDRYVDALCREMEMKAQRQKETINTIYLGGGTPSQLSMENLNKLFHHINKVYSPNPQSSIFNLQSSILPEITMECNPDDLTPDYVERLRLLPINRISMGAQTFDDARLRFLRRRNTAEEVRLAVRRLREAGFQNISIDLMFGFPNETLDDWKRDINAALALHVEHISAYCLTYEEGTVLYGQFQNKEIKKISEETEWKMYETLIDRLTTAGYEHYEISNFAKKPQTSNLKPQTSTFNYRSLHNSSYWRGIPYIGIGAAAHSYDITTRQWNVSDLFQYMEAIERGEIPCEQERLDDNTRYNDLITTALRTCEGIDLTTLDNKYYDYLMANAKPHLDNGRLQINDNHIHLTRKGLFISDAVMSDLIYI